MFQPMLKKSLGSNKNYDLFNIYIDILVFEFSYEIILMNYQNKIYKFIYLD